MDTIKNINVKSTSTKAEDKIKAKANDCASLRFVCELHGVSSEVCWIIMIHGCVHTTIVFADIRAGPLVKWRFVVYSQNKTGLN